MRRYNVLPVLVLLVSLATYLVLYLVLGKLFGSVVGCVFSSALCLACRARAHVRSFFLVLCVAVPAISCHLTARHTTPTYTLRPFHTRVALPSTSCAAVVVALEAIESPQITGAGSPLLLVATTSTPTLRTRSACTIKNSTAGPSFIPMTKPDTGSRSRLMSPA